MKLGIMQPYFFPYLGYFALIAQTDRWVVFDMTQYTRRSWLTRNRILHPSQGWQYITLPMDHASPSINICEARVLDRDAAARRILGQIEHYRRHAPFFPAVADLVRDTLRAGESQFLVDVCVSCLRNVFRYLGLPFNYLICSRENLPLPAITGPGLWALEISAVLKASEYVNPIGGQELFDRGAFAKRGIRLSFLPPPDFRYSCAPYSFIEHLSIVDVLMWNRPEAVKQALLTAPRSDGQGAA